MGGVGPDHRALGPVPPAGLEAGGTTSGGSVVGLRSTRSSRSRRTTARSGVPRTLRPAVGRARCRRAPPPAGARRSRRSAPAAPPRSAPPPRRSSTRCGCRRCPRRTGVRAVSPWIVLTSAMSTPSASAVSWTTVGLEAVAGRTASHVHVHLARRLDPDRRALGAVVAHRRSWSARRSCKCRRRGSALRRGPRPARARKAS